MKRLIIISSVVLLTLVLVLFVAYRLLFPDPAHSYEHAEALQDDPNAPLRCVAFSPYVGNLTPDYGMHPSSKLLDTLLDRLIEQTGFRCIMTYGVLDGLDYVFKAAKARNLKVIAILWLDDDVGVNSRSIARGIQVAKEYPETIIRISCGSEVRTRHGYRFDTEISRCINSLKHAGVAQPITTIDTWWEWCNRSWPCQPSKFGASVDWIGANVFPWWENKHSGIFTCTPSRMAADFHIARLEDLHRVYHGKQIILTEFGWPRGPSEGEETNQHNGDQCGVASRPNQLQVITTTFKKLAERGWSGVAFEAYDENWKHNNEGLFGGYWGLCQSDPPYRCAEDL
jgi:exo-beta-1,3-glucanase (GH17 family)